MPDNEESPLSFAATLRAVLGHRGLQGKDLAAIVAVSSGTVSRWLQKKMLPPPSRIGMIERALVLPAGLLTAGKSREAVLKALKPEPLTIGNVREGVSEAGRSYSLDAEPGSYTVNPPPAQMRVRALPPGVRGSEIKANVSAGAKVSGKVTAEIEPGMDPIRTVQVMVAADVLATAANGANELLNANQLNAAEQTLWRAIKAAEKELRGEGVTAEEEGPKASVIASGSRHGDTSKQVTQSESTDEEEGQAQNRTGSDE